MSSTWHNSIVSSQVWLTWIEKEKKKKRLKRPLLSFIHLFLVYQQPASSIRTPSCNVKDKEQRTVSSNLDQVWLEECPSLCLSFCLRAFLCFNENIYRFNQKKKKNVVRYFETLRLPRFHYVEKESPFLFLKPSFRLFKIKQLSSFSSKLLHLPLNKDPLIALSLHNN